MSVCRQVDENMRVCRHLESRLQRVCNICRCRRMEGVGSGVGEPPEQAWSHLGPYGYILQYHSLPSRQTYLEHIIAHWNADKMLGLPLALLKMYKRARQEHQAAIQTADGLLQYASSILQIPVQEVGLPMHQGCSQGHFLWL